MENALATHGRWLSLPRAQPLLDRVRTRYLPWDLLLEEMEVHRDFSGYAEVHNGLQSGRIFWLEGVQRAVLMQERSARATITDLWWRVELADLSSVSADVEVSVYPLEARLGRLALECSFADAKLLDPNLSNTYPQLSQSQFSGIMSVLGSAGRATLYWWQGAVIERLGKSDDALGEIKLLEVYTAQIAPSASSATPSASSADTPPAEMPLDPTPMVEGQPMPSQLVAFFNSALALSGNPSALEAAWRSAALDLSPDHPCLDPFADEVRIEGNRLELLAEVPFAELQPALLEAYLLTLERAGVRLNRLPLEGLRQQQRGLWKASGLEGVPGAV